MKTHKKYSAMCQRKKRPKIFRKPMKPTKKQMQKLWRRQKLARTRSVIYDGILIFMTVLYSTIILISREDTFFHQGAFLDTIFNISGCHRHTHTNETRKPLIFARRAWSVSLLFRTRYFIDFTSIEEDPKDSPRELGKNPLFFTYRYFVLKKRTPRIQLKRLHRWSPCLHLKKYLMKPVLSCFQYKGPGPRAWGPLFIGSPGDVLGYNFQYKRVWHTHTTPENL